MTEFGRFSFNAETLELFDGDNRIPLAPKPGTLLAALIRAAPGIVTREEAQNALWPNQQYVDAEQSLNACVRQLRAALGDNASSPQYIETLPKRGYRLIAQPTEILAQTARSNGAFKPYWKILGPGLAAVVSVALGVFVIFSSEMGAATDQDRLESEVYARAAALRARQQGTDLNQALSLYENVLREHPQSARALAGKAFILSKLASRKRPPDLQAYASALEFARAADAVEPLADASSARGTVILNSSLNAEQALAEFEEAISRDARSADAFIGIAAASGAMGRTDDAVAAATMATRLDPRSYSARSDRCWYLLFGDRYQEAEDACAWAVEIDANHTYSHLGLALAVRDNPAEFRRWFESYLIDSGLTFDSSDFKGETLGCGPAERGAALAEKGEISPYEAAALFGLCRDSERAGVWLQEAAQIRQPALLYLPFDPRFDDVRDLIPSRESLLGAAVL